MVGAVVGAVFTADLPGYMRSYAPGTPTAAEAQIVKATLKSAGIPAFVQPATIALPGESITDTDSPDLEVLVAVDRLTEARAVLCEQVADEEE